MAKKIVKKTTVKSPSVVSLKALARRKKIKGYSKMNKVKLIKAIKSSKGVRSPPTDKKLQEGTCLGMTVKQIKQTQEYKGLTPLGKRNKSGTYRYGNKSTMRKAELCEALSNPEKYHLKIGKLKSLKKNAGPRKRPTRTGACLVAKRKIPCNDSVYKFEGLTTTGARCCYKKQQSEKTMAKRMKNATKQIKAQAVRPRGRPRKST